MSYLGVDLNKSLLENLLDEKFDPQAEKLTISDQLYFMKDTWINRLFIRLNEMFCYGGGCFDEWKVAQRVNELLIPEIYSDKYKDRLNIMNINLIKLENFLLNRTTANEKKDQIIEQRFRLVRESIRTLPLYEYAWQNTK